MTTELIIKIIVAIFTILYAIISAYLIPWIRTKIGSDKLEDIIIYTELAVRSAEQLYTAEQWALKKEYVYNYISGLCAEHGIKLTPADIDVIIEGCVNEIKKG